MKDNWWALLIFALLFIAFNILVLVCIVRHIDSDNPEHSQRESLLDTLTSPFNLVSATSNKHTQLVSTAAHYSKHG